MRGFFSAEEVQTLTAVSLGDNTLPNCAKCGLHRKCISPKMPVSGGGRLKALIIAECPGEQEDLQGVQLVGKAGQLLRTNLHKLGLDLDKDFWKINAVNCRAISPSGANRTPTKTEIKCCKPYVDSVIQSLNPHVIWLLGGKAVESFYMDRFSRLSIGRWRGLCIPDKKWNAWVVPMFHPSYVNRNERDLNLVSVFVRDLKFGKKSLLKKDLPVINNQVQILLDLPSIVDFLTKLSTAKNVYVALDYETNSLKSQWPNAKVIAISLCTGRGSAVAFPYHYSDHFSAKERLKIKALMRKLFQNPGIYWIAHNVQFEDSWTRNHFGLRPVNWHWDTMIASHILDNRKEFTNLKFQTYVNFGIDPYDKEIEPYLKARGDNTYNDIDNAPLQKLLEYNGLDTCYTWLLYEKQKEAFTVNGSLDPKTNQTKAFNLFHEGTLVFSDIHNTGIYANMDYYTKQNTLISARITQLTDKLKASEEAALFQKQTGREIDLGSGKDIGVLMYTVLGNEPIFTAKANLAVDAKALSASKIPFAAQLLDLRRLEKIKGTYFAQLFREVCAGKIHPFFGLNVARSYRSSSQAPNWQNQPSHNAESGQLVRSGFIPPKGYKFCEIDYKSIEVRVAAMYTADPSLITYVTDDSTDMHRDSSCDIWLLPPEEIAKEVRFHAKGGWVFAQFYGSYYKNCAKDLWENCVRGNLTTVSGRPLREHLKTKKIKSFDDFVEHCKTAEDIFWNRRFRVYKKWKESINTLYRQQGYIESYYGFRFTGYMTEKEVTNYPIQGTAFHILLEALIRINQARLQEKWKSKIIGQIHDSILLYLHPDEEEHVLRLCNYIMSEEVKNAHDWINVPIPVEIEMTDVDGSWWEKKEILIEMERQ